MYAKYRNTLINNGYVPLPVRGKKPVVKRFNDANYVPPMGFKGFSAAILCGSGEFPVCAIDIDITDSAIATLITKHTFDIHGRTAYRIGQHPKKTLVYRAKKAGIHKRQTNKYAEGQIEILGAGQSCTMYGIHEKTLEPYTWPDTSIINIHAAELPILSEEDIDSMIREYNKILLALGCVVVAKETSTLRVSDYDHTDPLDVKEPVGVCASDIKGALDKIDSGCSRQTWIQIGMSLHHETQGSLAGFELWDDWSRGSHKYQENEMGDKWDSFGKYTGEPITIAYLLKLSKEEESANINTTTPPSPEAVQKVYVPSWENVPPKPEPLLSLCGNRILSRGSIAVLSAPAGQGKTQVVSAICAAIANSDFNSIDTIGFESEARSATYIDTEQSKWEHHNTWTRYMFRLGLSETDKTPSNINFRLISEMDSLKERRAYLFGVLNNDAPDIVILDGIGDYVNDVNDSKECVTLIYKLSAIVKEKNIALLTTLHVNPSVNAEKMRGILGSELWRKAEFSAIIKRVNSEIRCLTTEYLLGKNRSGTDNISQHFRYCKKLQLMVSCGAPATPKEEQASDRSSLVLELLRSVEGSDVKRTDIEQSVPCSRYLLDRTLAHLEEQNLISIEKKGRSTVYAISQKEGLALW